MKKVIFATLLAGIFSFGQAQVPDSTSKIKSSSQYRTDSVRHGNEVYNGAKSRKGKSNGDTLATPRNSKKNGTKATGTTSK